MSILLRAAVLGGIAYLITRSLSGNSPMARRSVASRHGGASSRRDLESNIWPTSESQQTTAENVAPSS